MCSSFLCYSQSKTLAKFRITEATDDGQDVTEWYYNRGQQIVFYLCDDGSLCLSNFSERENEQSYGGLTSLGKVETLPETRTTFKIDIFKFRWNYFNTYDSKRGWATVSMYKIYKPQGVVFNMKVALSNLNIMKYKGYMEGSIDFSQY